MTAPTLVQAWNDAGLLREYVVDRFGRYFVSGLDGASVQRLQRLVSRLSHLTGLPKQQVLCDLAADARSA